MDLEEAKIKLALLKENFEYQGFFTGFSEWYPRYEAAGDWENEHGRKGEVDLPDHITERDFVFPRGQFEYFGLVGIRYFLGRRDIQKIFDVIDPDKPADSFPEKFMTSILSWLFYEPAVSLVTDGIKQDREGFAFSKQIIRSERPLRSIKGRLKSWNRIYCVDLTKKKKQILKEFEAYLNAAYSSNSGKEWNEDKSRQRKETWAHLNVWNMRRQKGNFSEISKKLGITIDAAKKSFYRAYELTQHKKYDPDVFKKLWEIKKSDLENPCETCPQKADCTELCPDVLRFVDQDYVELREKTIGSNPNELMDYLSIR